MFCDNAKCNSMSLIQVNTVVDRGKAKNTAFDLKQTEKQEDNPNYLSEFSIHYYRKTEEKQRPAVPPNTPQNVISDCYVTKLPKIPDNVNDIEIPLIREVGIRNSIVNLAKYFECNEYRFSLVQFWFLDILVDIIWKCQDEFRFPVEYQKVIINWIMFIINLVSMKDMTKPKLFLIFEEALSIAEDYVQSGCKIAPSPNEIFTLKNEHSSEKSFSSLRTDSTSTASQSIRTDRVKSGTRIAIKTKDKILAFCIPNNFLNIEFECGSSIESIWPEEINQVKHASGDADSEGSNQKSSLYSGSFWKPRWGTPERFKSLSELKSVSSENRISGSVSDNSEGLLNYDGFGGDWVNIKRRPSLPKCPDVFEERKQPITSQHKKISDISQSSHEIPNYTENDIFRLFYIYNLWLLREEFMADPRKGWTSLVEEKGHKDSNPASSKEFTERDQFKEYLENERDKLKEMRRNIFINSCVLMVVKEIVFDYFEDEFCFTLAKSALMNVQYLLTQDINSDWKIPKLIKGEVKKPKPKKPKKEKKKKEKKPKKDKKSDKKSKKSKSSKKSDKKSKKEKKSKKDKKSKKSKSDKSSKKKGKTKEEKAEEERLKREAAVLLKDQLKELENKTFMFPLKEAVDDQFFSKIFENYKPKKGKEPKEKKKKTKGSDKGSKKSKRSKK